MSALVYRLFVIICLVSTIYGQNKCSPADDRYFNVSKNKCKDCPRCPLGKGRRLTQTNYDQDTATNTECLPCQVCTFGTYNDRRGLTNECRRCTNNKCSNLYRRVEQNCTSTHDFVCGQCQSGYEDIYRNTALACVKITPKPEAAGQTLARSVLVGSRTTPIPETEQRTHETIQWTLPLILGVLVLIFVMGIFAYWKGCKKEKCQDTARRVEEGTCVHGQSSSTIVSTTSEESEPLVEQDGPIEKNEDVRAEIQSIAEVHSSGIDGQGVNYRNGNEYHIEYNHFEMKCSCPQWPCGNNCKNKMIDANIIKKGDKLLDEVACSICHDPTLFFRQLGVPDPIVYGLDNDRQRSIHTITQKEFIHSVLRRWTELQTTNATVDKMRQALCSTGFHRINETVMPRDTFSK